MKQPLLGSNEHKSGGGAIQMEKSRQEQELEEERAFIAETDPIRGLTAAEHAARLEKYGPNKLPEVEVNVCLKFLSYFWGPMPIMIWLAIIVEAINQDWEDFVVLAILQFVNGMVGFIEEHNAGNAIAALKNSLRPACRVCRDGKMEVGDATSLVPGDLIELVIGDVVPADAILLGPGDPMQVDQSALTGESLPVSIHPGGKVKMGSSVKRGELKAVVCATGANTFFGKAADLLNIEDTQGRFQKILFKITLALLLISLVLCAIIFIDLLVTAEDTTSHTVFGALSVVIVLLVASIPIAMQVVCTSTMAVGSRRLAQRKVIVARLSAIEELAGMTILCSDKTGTLTQNKLSLREPNLMGDMTDQELIFYAALAAKRGNMQDAIDACICNAVTNKEALKEFEEIQYVPFNPTDKRTEATIRAPGDGSIFRVTKGAPQIVLHMAHNAAELQATTEAAIQSLADRGFRALGVAISYSPPDQEPKWEFQGLLALFDPPRYDTKKTIETAVAMGVEVKMITGDQTAIAKETCRELGMGTNILNTDVLTDPNQSGLDLDAIIMESHGFAEVYPEHKFLIVDRIRKQDYVTGMTGDGVNDAPALKRADIGIAVEGATDAAKAAADIVLIEPGLSVIIEAIQRSRKIFQRMRNYCIYRIACTIQLLFFFFFAVLFIRPDELSHGAEDFKNFTLPVIAIVIITILNDGTIITIAHDKVIPDRRPQKWDLREVVIVSTLLGLVPCMSSMLILVLGIKANVNAQPNWFSNLLGSHVNPKTGSYYLEFEELRTLMYMKISLSDFLTVFSGRCRGFFFERRPGYALSCAFVFATGCSTLLSVFWFFSSNVSDENPDPMKRIALKTCLTVWVYNLLWFIVQDIAKVMLYYVMARFRKEEEDEMAKRQTQRRVASAMEADSRAGRAAGYVRESSTSSVGRRMSVTNTEVAGLKQKVLAMEHELQRVTKLVESLTKMNEDNN